MDGVVNGAGHHDALPADEVAGDAGHDDGCHGWRRAEIGGGEGRLRGAVDSGRNRSEWAATVQTA